jgi:hypothetical protein
LTRKLSRLCAFFARQFHRSNSRSHMYSRIHWLRPLRFVTCQAGPMTRTWLRLTYRLNLAMAEMEDIAPTGQQSAENNVWSVGITPGINAQHACRYACGAMPLVLRLRAILRRVLRLYWGLPSTEYHHNMSIWRYFMAPPAAPQVPILTKTLTS